MLLFRSWQRYVVLMAFFALWIGEFGREVLTNYLKLISLQPSETFLIIDPLRYVQSEWLGPLMVWYQWRELSLFARFLGLAVLLLICQFLAVSPMMDMPTQPLADTTLLRHLQEPPPEVHARGTLR